MNSFRACGVFLRIKQWCEDSLRKLNEILKSDFIKMVM